MSEMNEQRRDALPPGARLDANKYEIEEVLGSGGFGLVYRVRHLLLDEERAIKEYLPSEIAVRDGETVYARSGAHESDYQDGLHLGPWTDVYAVGALMWRVATGSVPPSAESRSFALVRGRSRTTQTQRNPG